MTYEDRVEKVKMALSVEQVVAISQPLSGQGRWLKGVDHDSLIVDTEKQVWFWNSQFKQGDHITWVQEYIPVNPKTLDIDPNGSTGCSFGVALAFLEKMASGVLPENYRPPDIKVKTLIHPDKSVADLYHKNLLESAEGQTAWMNRGIGEYHWDKWNLGYKFNHWGRGPSLAIPIYEDSNLKTIRHRIINPVDGKRYLPEMEGSGAWLFNIDILLEKPQEVFIIEGEIKCLVAASFDINGIGTSGIMILPDRYFERLAKVPVIYVCPDPVINKKKRDVTPYHIRWVQELSRMTDVRVLALPDKLDDMLMRPGREIEETFRAFQAIKRTARRVTPQLIDSLR